MRVNRSSTAPLYIPDELLRAYGPEARWQVAASVAARDTSRALPPLRSAAATGGTHRLVRIAAYGGLGIWGALVVMWGWLALGDPMLWTPIVVSGAVVLVLAAVALPRLFGARRVRRLP